MTQPLTVEERLELLDGMRPYWGPQGAPGTVCLFGPPGSGKTADTGLAFHTNAIYVGIKQHLASIPAMTGIPMESYAHYNVGMLGQVFPILAQAARWNLERLRQGAQPFLALVIDDLQYLADGQFQARSAEINAIRAREGKKPDTRGAFLATDNDMQALQRAGRDIGMHLVATAHAREPDDKLPRGTLSLPSRNMGTKAAGQFGTLLYAELENRSQVVPTIPIPGAPEAAKEEVFGWPGVYYSHHPQFICRDRFNTAPPKGPMNLREIMTAAGHVLPRPAGAEWMDEMVEGIATDLASGQSYWDEVRPRYTKALEGQPPAWIAWVMRDGIDRYRLRKASEKPLFY